MKNYAINMFKNIENDPIFQKIILENKSLNRIWNILTRKSVTIILILITLSIFFIYRFGYRFGKFFYYITH